MFKYSHSGGRNKASEWLEVTYLSDEPNRVLCNYCKEVIIKKIERVRNHLRKCKERMKRSTVDQDPPSITPIYEPSEELKLHNVSNISMNVSDADISDISSPSFSFNTSNITSSTPCKSSSQQPSISSFVVTTKKEMKNELDLQVGRFFSANIPFAVTENEQFQRLMTKLSPGYLPTNRKNLSNDILPKINEEVIQSLTKELQESSTVTLIQDGWSSVGNDPNIAHSIHNGEKSYLISTTDPGSKKKTAEYCAELSKVAIKIIKEKYNKHVCRLFENTNISGKDWWKMIEMKEEKESKLPESFPQFMISLHICPASSESLERMFSTFGTVWNK